MGIAASIISVPLAGIATCGGSLFGSCCATVACKACSCRCLASTRVSSLMYYLIITIFVSGALITEYHGGDIVLGGQIKNKILDMYTTTKTLVSHKENSCPSKYITGWVICCANTCSGAFSVYRFSIALFMFSMTMLILTCSKTKMSSKIHCGYWVSKLGYIILLLGLTLFFENETLVRYREFARYISIPFLFLQIVLLIDSAYKCNTMCIDWDESVDGGKCMKWKVCLLILSILMYIVSILAIVLMFMQFGNDGCVLQQTFISLTITATCMLTIVSCSNIAPHGTIFTSAIVTTYCTYLCYSALVSYPDIQCNPKTNENSISDMVVGLLLTSLSMASLAWNMTNSQQIVLGNDSLLKRGTTENDETTENTEDIQPETWWYFHSMICLCSLYMCMLLTGWSSIPCDTNYTEISDYNVGLRSFWVKNISQWSCMCLYCWTLLAPYLLRNHRDFGIEFNR
jgi:hypothetical protein